MNVYITYENSPRTPVTGIYTNMNLAHEEREKRRDLDCIDIMELQGPYNRNLQDINQDCKYFSKRLLTIAKLIECLYDLEDCICGGIAHVLVDDNNFDDKTIEFVAGLCDLEENKDKEEVGLVRLICEELKKLTMQERALLFSSYYSYRGPCRNCEQCPINKGKIIID